MPDGPPRIRGFDYRGVYRYSLTICVHGRRNLFTDRETVTPVLSEIDHAADLGGFVILVYCFMRDHLHLVIEGKTDDLDLKKFMNRWKQKTAFNYARDNRGVRLWQTGYFDHVLRSDEETRRHILYILATRSVAGLAQTIGEYTLTGGDCAWRWTCRKRDPPKPTFRRAKALRLPTPATASG
jgi:REP element-mobilizing transposase RayT